MKTELQLMRPASIACEIRTSAGIRAILKHFVLSFLDTPPPATTEPVTRANRNRRDEKGQGTV